MRVPIGKPGGRRAKYLAIGLIAILEVSAVLYVYLEAPVYSGPTYVIPSPTTKTTTATATTKPTPPNSITVESALISNGTLNLDVYNKGPSATTEMEVTELCSPGFFTCLSYKKLSGVFYTSIFVLPAGRTFSANFTGICYFPILGCKRYFPVTGSEYYLDVEFLFAKGSPVTVPLSVLSNNTWAPRTSVTNITSNAIAFEGNLTGRLYVNVTSNFNVNAVNYTTSLNAYKSAGRGYSTSLIENETGCGGSLPTACGSPIPVLIDFNSVQTDLYPGGYAAVVVHDLNVTGTYFAMWDPVQNGQTTTTTTTSTS